jgi:hypothetical protein
VGYGFESLAGEDRYDLRENWVRHNMIDEAFMLYQSVNEIWNISCELHHTSVK